MDDDICFSGVVNYIFIIKCFVKGTGYGLSLNEISPYVRAFFRVLNSFFTAI